MGLKRALLAGVALTTIGFAGTADASERLSMHEINTFIAQYTNAMNSPSAAIGSRFLENHVATNTTFQDNLNAWADGRYYHQAWNGYDYVSPYYRYPHYAYNGYLKPTSFQSVGKSEKIDRFEHKKSVIPRYHQMTDVIAASVSLDAKTAVSGWND